MLSGNAHAKLTPEHRRTLRTPGEMIGDEVLTMLLL